MINNEQQLLNTIMKNNSHFYLIGDKISKVYKAQPKYSAIVLATFVGIILLSFLSYGFISSIVIIVSSAFAGFLIATMAYESEGLAKKSNVSGESLLANTSEIIASYSPATQKCTYISPSIQTVLGHPIKDLKNYYDLSFIYKKDKASFLLKLNKLKEHTDTPLTAVVRLKRKFGGFIWAEVKAQAICKEKNKIDSIVLSFRDITERRVLTLANEDYIKELERKIQKFESDKTDIDQFAFIMSSHDMKEPLRTISSYSSMLESRYKDQLDENGKEFISFISTSANRMAGMIDEVLAFSSVRSKTTVIEEVKVNEVLDTVMRTMGHSIYKNKAEITFKKLPTVIADKRQLSRLFQNLIDNAIKYRTNKNPKINITCTKKSNQFEFRVTDNGIGINKEFHDTIFDSFERVNSSMGIKGTGLGLAICKKIVDNHEGKIWIESKGSNQGSSFCFTLPLLKIEQKKLNNEQCKKKLTLESSNV